MRKRLKTFLVLLCLSFALFACSNGGSASNTTNAAATKQSSQTQVTQPGGTFHEYALPQNKSGIMRPAIDHQQHIWFGEMGHNYLTEFDPVSKTFHQFPTPHGQYGIMGVVVAADNSIWFAEQYANYIGHYDPRSNHFTTYALPSINTPDPNNSKQTLKLPLAPNELAIDAQGNVWFTEMNADAIGKLDTQSGKFTHYPLSSPRTVQQINPYGITIDKSNMVWFTEAGKDAIGRLDPQTGALHIYSDPQPNTSFMEITSANTGQLWLTTFNASALIQFNPQTGTFASYHATANDGGISGMYGVAISPTNAIWVTVPAANAIARFDPQSKKFQYYTIPTGSVTPLGLVIDQHNTLWFTESAKDQLGVLQP